MKRSVFGLAMVVALLAMLSSIQTYSSSGYRDYSLIERTRTEPEQSDILYFVKRKKRWPKLPGRDYVYEPLPLAAFTNRLLNDPMDFPTLDYGNGEMKREWVLATGK